MPSRKLYPCICLLGHTRRAMVNRCALALEEIERRNRPVQSWADLHAVIGARLPEATYGEDNDGQIIVYTNLRETANGLAPFDPED